MRAVLRFPAGRYFLRRRRERGGKTRRAVVARRRVEAVDCPRVGARRDESRRRRAEAKVRRGVKSMNSLAAYYSITSRRDRDARL